MQLADINQLPHRAIRFTCIKQQFPFKPNRLYHQFSQFANSQFLACTDIDMAVSYLTQRGNSSTTPRRMVAIDCAISGYAIVDLGVFLDADDVGEVNIKQDMHTGPVPQRVTLLASIP